MSEQKLKSDNAISIGANIRRIRLSRHMGQIELVRKLDLIGVPITHESLVKIERGIQHIYASQLSGIRMVLETTYDDLLAPMDGDVL